MKKRLADLLKYNKVIYRFYFYIMSMLIRLAGLFVPTDDRLILFNSFGGQKFDDSPRAAFERMKADPRFRGYRFVWAFHDPERYEVDGGEKIKTDTPKYFVTALRAKVWVTNSSMERGLSFKKKNTFCLNTWHGTPIKKMGSDIEEDQSFGTKSRNIADIMNAQSYYEADIFSRCFGIPRSRFLECGLPRNDILANYTEEYKEELRKKLKIPEGKKAILYCPTFREYEKDKNFSVVLAPPMDLRKWKERLGDQYVLLFRAHYEVSKVMGIEENDFLRDVTDYPVLNDLMIASDILISDYSSTFFDYSIMDKCMLHFTYDYEEYEKKRGMYFDIREYISGSDTEDGVIGILASLDYAAELRKSQKFRDRFVNFYGSATEQTVDRIADHLM